MAVLEQILIDLQVTDAPAVASAKRVEVALKLLGAAAEAVASPIASVMDVVARSQEATSAALKGLARDSRTGARGLGVLGAAAAGLLTDLEKLEPTLARQAEQIRALADATAALRRARAQGEGAGGAPTAKLPEAAPDFSPVHSQIGGIQTAAKAAGVDVAALGGDFRRLGKAMDEATDPINELRNGIDGLGDRLVLFGAQGERLRNEIEEIRDPALRAKIANEQWAQAQGNLNGFLGRAGDQLQVLKVRAAGAVGGIDNLNRITLAAVAATGLLVAGVVKLADAIVGQLAKAFEIYAKTQQDYVHRTNLAEAQTEGLYHEIGRAADVVLNLQKKQDALGQSTTEAAALVGRLADQYRQLTPRAQRNLQVFGESLVAYGTGNLWLNTLSASEEKLSLRQRRVAHDTEQTTKRFKEQAKVLKDLGDQHDKYIKAIGGGAGAAVGRYAGQVKYELDGVLKTYNQIKQSVATAPKGRGGKPLSLLEQVLGESYWEEIEGAQRWREELRGISDEIDRVRAQRAQGPQAAAAALGNIGLPTGEGAGLEQISAVSKALNSSELEVGRAQLEAYLGLTGQLKRGLLDVGIAAGAGFAALAAGAGTGGEVFGSFITNLGQLATSLGETLILAGAGFAALPLGFSAAGAVAAGAGLVALGVGLGVAGGSIGARGAGGGASVGAAPSLGLSGITPPTDADRRAATVQVFKLYLAATEVGEVVVGAVQDAQRRGALNLDRR